ncbi:hypothetical protein ACFWIN_20695 [Streptomyces sp. NPDC127049]|uniref:hypothetical protein n=1 Tax=unclassified Streptomyces TaxID=2593676 RepID=UPI003647F6E9
MVANEARIDGDSLLLGDGVRVRFVRTLRLPETGTHGLPPGLGTFPLRRVEDHLDTVPEQWRAKGGVMMPVYLREAMWLSFAGSPEPTALQVGVGKVCAISGEKWTGRLSRRPQNYVVLPRQPWLDGINSGKGTVRQFVAVPLGMGATVEGQVTGEETVGGLQLQAFPLAPKPRAAWREEQRRLAEERRRQAEERARLLAAGPPPAPSFGGYGGAPAMPMAAPAGAPRAAAAMGIGAGGTMRQEVYKDDRPARDWSDTADARVFVHLVTPPEWRRITGEEPPPSPVDRAAYTRAGLPWYDYFDADGTDLAPSGPLADVKPVGEWLGDDLDPWTPPSPYQVKPLGPPPPPPGGAPIADGDW